MIHEVFNCSNVLLELTNSSFILRPSAFPDRAGQPTAIRHFTTNRRVRARDDLDWRLSIYRVKRRPSRLRTGANLAAGILSGLRVDSLIPPAEPIREMSERITKVQRWLDLVAYLIGRRYPVTVTQIMENVPAYARKWLDGSETDRASVRRTFERDKDELRDLGIKIETTETHANYGLLREEGYLLARGDFYLPELKLGGEGRTPATRRIDKHRIPGVALDEDEARAALDALRRLMDLPASPFAREAHSAYLKLAFDIDPEHFEPAPVLFVEPPGASELLDTLGTLSDAVLARKMVTFRYHGIHRGETTSRRVAPYGLFFQLGHWYLVGHDETREALRVFRVARMEEVEVNQKEPKTPDYEVPADFRIDDYLDRKAWALGDREAETRAEVHFRYPASLWAERIGAGEIIERRPDQSTVHAFEIQQSAPFLRWILSLAGEATLLGPAELVDELREMVDGVAQIYAEVMAGQEER